MVIHETVNMCLKCGNAGVPTGPLCLHLADAIQAEVNVLKLQKKFGGQAHVMLRGSARRHVREINVRAKRALDMLDVTDWSASLKVQLGAVLIKALIDTAKIDTSTDGNSASLTNAFKHEIRTLKISKRLCDSCMLSAASLSLDLSVLFSVSSRAAAAAAAAVASTTVATSSIAVVSVIDRCCKQARATAITTIAYTAITSIN
eukprot:14077-Heterococcus_DN1.PRE.2